MTELRKTPRTDEQVRLDYFIKDGEKSLNIDFADHARALEIETQEMAEALSNAITWIEKGCVRSAHARLTDALAHHRAKQEVET